MSINPAGNLMVWASTGGYNCFLHTISSLVGSLATFFSMASKMTKLMEFLNFHGAYNTVPFTNYMNGITTVVTTSGGVIGRHVIGESFKIYPSS